MMVTRASAEEVKESKAETLKLAKPGESVSPTCTSALGFSSFHIVARKQMASEAWILNLWMEIWTDVSNQDGI